MHVSKLATVEDETTAVAYDVFRIQTVQGNDMLICETAWGPDADWHDNQLNSPNLTESAAGAYSQSSGAVLVLPLLPTARWGGYGPFKMLG